MNDANHQMNIVTTFPFYTLEGWEMNAPAPSDMPFKGDTVIGNDVWIGQNAFIMVSLRWMMISMWIDHHADVNNRQSVNGLTPYEGQAVFSNLLELCHI